MERFALPSLRLAAITSCCVWLLGCASAAVPAPAAPAGDAAAWQLDLSVDGGFAGIAQRFTTSAGSDTLVATDAKRGLDTLVPLADSERQELQRLVTERIGQPDADLRSASCRDCFNFELSMTSGKAGKPRRARYDSGSMDASPDARLIQRVLEIGRAGMARERR
jgi:hypothetical protein